MARWIWTVADASEGAPLGYFSTESSARQYAQLLRVRQSLGKNLSLHEQRLAARAHGSQCGVAPAVVEHSIDDPADVLPGAWIVTVDATCRMVACEFSTAYRPSQSPTQYGSGIQALCEAYGTTPHGALDSARKAMVSYLSANRSRG